MFYTQKKLCLLTYVSIITILRSVGFTFFLGRFNFIEINSALWAPRSEKSEKYTYKHETHANLASVCVSVLEFYARTFRSLIFILSVHVHARLQAELARLFTHLHYGRFNIVHLSQIASKRYKRQNERLLCMDDFQSQYVTPHVVSSEAKSKGRKS